MARPNLRTLNFWAEHERRVLEVLTIALQRLAKEPKLPATENPINRGLYRCILYAIREVYEQGLDLVSYPIYEGNNQPDAADQERAVREDKRPDFQFGFIDHQSPNPAASAKQYVVECKRLGESGRSDWILNVNYVEHGIVRFHDEEYGYAKSHPSGAMIGYVQNAGMDRILDEVNEAAIARGFTGIMLSPNGWKRGGVSSLNHRFDRAIRPTPFDLRHLWVDLSGYSQERSRKSTLAASRKGRPRPQSNSE